MQVRAAFSWADRALERCRLRRAPWEEVKLRMAVFRACPAWDDANMGGRRGRLYMPSRSSIPAKAAALVNSCSWADTLAGILGWLGDGQQSSVCRACV